jgi:hypothetical protein
MEKSGFQLMVGEVNSFYVSVIILHIYMYLLAMGPRKNAFPYVILSVGIFVN